MNQIPVDLEFDENDEPTFYVTEDGTRKWSYVSATHCDWRDTEGQIEEEAVDGCIALFDGSDTIVYVLSDDTINIY